MTAPFLLNQTAGPALGRAACHFERGYREFVRGLLVLDSVGLEPSEVLAELIEDIGDAAAASLVLADNFGQKLAESADFRQPGDGAASIEPRGSISLTDRPGEEVPA